MFLRVHNHGAEGAQGGQPNLGNVRESAYDALRKTSPKQQMKRNTMIALRGQSTWRVSSFMFHQGRLAMPSVGRGCIGTRHFFFHAEGLAD